MPPPTNVKLLLIGNSSVGKSSLLLRFSDETWLPEDEASATIGVDFRVHRLTLRNGKQVKLSIWDTAGQERFRTITASYYRGAQGVVLVYDVSSRESFEALPRWVGEMETYLGTVTEGPVRVVVGNKVDKEFSREVSTAEGRVFAERIGSLFVEASAKTSIGVNEAFTEVVERIIERGVSGSPPQRTDGGQGGVPGGVQLVGGTSQEQEAGGCAC
ncbi:ras-domain-containing protein [Guyanagaster necrorhizus]|uniref:Ras-domain-containing protein n=1 Tax=Guyanagaster necrorhizus TaxID=856835 RepID=A0A9P7VYU4_9AGAR|nr:ras-domain-containing protein [Guyanagaster necrorhizus MCA 3950]KAG7450106.1 ras-domain-containing protein [Guyanagaster necrorhizus MCA 3950]